MQDLIGISIGRYHILEKLGEGGMAVVYKAYDTRLETNVALKIIRTDKITSEAAPTMRKRFENEARKTAKLTHPNIVPVIDYGEYQGTPFLVMKYLPGGTLKKLTGKPMPYNEAINLIVPILEALDYAHRNGIIHRDVKPGNILLTESGEPMLSDFGIAKVLEAAEETMDNLTVTGVGIGTPEYMSPEQARGHDVDARTDIYAIGVVLYELVTGRKPFIADTPLAVVIKQTIDALPSPRSFVAEIPEPVERVLFKALAKSPEDRFKNAREFIHWLKKIDSPEVMELQIPVQNETTPIKTKPLKKRWGFGLIPAFLFAAVIIFLLENDFAGTATDPTQTQAPPLVYGPTMTIMPTNTATQMVMPENTTAPVVDYSYIFSNPHVGPAPEGAYMRIGKGTIHDTDITLDNRFLIVATNLGLYVYDVNSLKLTRYLPVEVEPYQVEINPDGTSFVSTDFNGNLTIWDLPTFELRETIFIAKQGVKDIEFTSDGSRLIIACLDQTIRILDTNKGGIIKTIFFESVVPISLDVHPSDKVIAVLFGNSSFSIYDIESGIAVASIPSPNNKNQDLPSDDVYYYNWFNERIYYSVDGSLLYISTRSHRDVYRTINYEKIFTFSKTMDFAESTDLIKVATIKEDSLIITELDTGHAKVYPPIYGGSSLNNGGTYIEIYFSHDSTRLIQVETYYIKLYDLEDDYQVHTLQGYEIFEYIDYLNNTNQLLTRSMNNPFGLNPPSIWDENLETVINLEDPIFKKNDVGHGEEPQFFIQSPDGNFIAGTLDEPYPEGSRFLYLWNSKTGEFIKRLPSISNSNKSMSFSWDNENIAIGMKDGSVQILSIRSGAFTHTINTNQSWPIVQYSPSGKDLITIGTDGSIKVWETEKYSLIIEINRNAVIYCLDFSLDGKVMITGDSKGNVLIWDTSTWEIVDQIEASEKGISYIKISHDQEKFALISDKTIQVWGFSRIEKIMEIQAAEPLDRLSFSGDDRFLLSSTNPERSSSLFENTSTIIWQIDI